MFTRTCCAILSRRIFSTRAWIFGSSRSCSEQRHTARNQGGAKKEALIFYSFHPRCGETVEIVERLSCRNLEIFVIRQPDGTRARMPAWMFDEAAGRFAIAAKPTFPILALRILRAEIDLLLGLMRSDSGPQEPENEASPKAQCANSVRRRSAGAGPDASSRSRSAKAATGDVRTNRKRDEDPGGGQ
jgi:hypothetical protein